MSIDEIGGFAIKITYQQNGISAIKPFYSVGGQIKGGVDAFFIGGKESIIGPSADGWYRISVPFDFFGDAENVHSKLFKVQMWVTPENVQVAEDGFIIGSSKYSTYAQWLKKVKLDRLNSDFSNIMIVKCITKPNISILNANVRSTVVTVVQREFSLNPLIVGQVELFDDEYLDQYRFTLYDDSGKEIESSGWIQNDSYNEVSVTHRFKQTLKDNTDYSVDFEILTGSGYQGSAEKPYKFQTCSSMLGDLKYWDFKYEESEFDRENACATLQLQYTRSLTNILGRNYLILRTDQDSNYSIWEPLKYFMIDSENEMSFERNDNDYYIFRDFTVECGKKYRYGLVEENNIGSRSNVLEMTGFGDSQFTTQTVQIFFEYSYIFANGIQLRLPFDCELSSFKRTKLQSKVDTIGSKYPTICTNGMADYAEFPISATISILSDEYDTFIQKNEKGMYQNGDLLFATDFFKQLRKRYPCENIPANEESYRNEVTTNNNDNNTLYERIFRETVIDFLGNNKPKLFKSSTEGNMIIGLINVSTTPEKSVNRMFSKLSATAYEIMDNTLENMNEYSIIDIGAYNDEIDLRRVGLGQLSGCFTGLKTREKDSIRDTRAEKQDLIQIIKGRCNSVVQGTLQRNFKRIKSFWIELHPDIDNQKEKKKLDNLLPHYVLETEIGDQTWSALTDRAWNNIVPFYVTEAIKGDTSANPKSYGVYEKDSKTQEFFLSEDEEWVDGKQYYWDYQESELYKLRAARRDLLKKIEDNRTMANAISTVPMIVNDTKIYVGINQIYSFDDDEVDIQSLCFDFTTPVVFNYTYEYNLKLAEKETVLSEDKSEIFGQVVGIFTSKENTLYAYDLGFEDRETETVSFPVDKDGIKQSHWDVFRTNNIGKVIKERCMQRIADAYNCTSAFEDAGKDSNDNQRYYYQDDEWGLYYTFGDFIGLKFEALPGTHIAIKYLQGSETIVKDYYMNESYCLVIKPSNDLRIMDIYVNDDDSSNKFLAIDYICQTSQTRVAAKKVVTE